jgi:tetratricopeptide (TPR) repeat protein
MGTPEELVSEGVQKYKSAVEGGLPAILVLARFEDAFRCFNQAAPGFPAGSDEASTCYRNAARASQRIALIHRADVPKRDYYFREACENLIKCLAAHDEERKLRARGDLVELFKTIWTATSSQSAIETLLSGLRDRTLVGMCNLWYGQQMHREAVKLNEAHGFADIDDGSDNDSDTEAVPMDLDDTEETDKCVKKWLDETHRPIVIAMQQAEYLKDPRMQQEVEELQQGVHLLMKSCESCKWRRQGLGLLNRVMDDMEAMDMEGIWVVIDLLHQAAVEARGVDIENEACAQSWLGHVYKALRMEDRAHTYFKQAILLAHSLEPMTRQFKTKWYKQAQAYVQKAQEERQQKEKEEQEGKDKVIKEKIADILKTLNDTHTAKVDGDKIGFLQWVYTTHPPKNPEHKIYSPLSSETVKKAFQTSVLHYHPDKNVSWGDEWRVLSGEITKLLNACYEYYKA